MKFVAFGFLFAAYALFIIALAVPSRRWTGYDWPLGNANNLQP